MHQFDHHSAEFAQHWRELYATMRQECPVSHSDAYGGFTVLTRYADVKEALLTSSTFVSGRDLHIDGVDGVVPGGVTVPRNDFRMGMMEMDRPESAGYRKILVPWFSARAVRGHSDHIRDLVTWCIDRVIESGTMDVVDDLANPLPALVTLDIMGLPLEKWEWYAHTLHSAGYREKGSAKQVVALLKDLHAIVEERQQSPAAIPTPIDALIAAEVDGQSLSKDNIVEMVFMLLNGGIDTTTALIAHVFRYLSAHPEARQQLQDDPSLIPAAVDEFVRWVTPGPGISRTVVKATTMGDTELAPGDTVFLALGSANNDPAEFPDPDRVDFHRDAKGHLGFGGGVHRCLGSFLAPLEMTILLEEILQRVPDFKVDESGVLAYPSIPLVSGFQAMPATFTPGAKKGRVSTDGVPPARDERALLAAAAVAAEGGDDE